MIDGFIPRSVRRKLRMGMGSRASRRNGTKSHKAALKKTLKPHPRIALNVRLVRWLEEH